MVGKGVFVLGGVTTGTANAAKPAPVVAAAADAVGLGPNNPPMADAKLLNTEPIPPAMPPTMPSAVSIKGTPVLIVPNPPVANNVDPGN